MSTAAAQPADGVLGVATVTFVHTAPGSATVSGSIECNGTTVAFDGWMMLLGELERAVGRLTAGDEYDHLPSTNRAT